MATKKPRYMISVDEDMYHEIEDFRYENRFPTRSEATAELIRLGLEAVHHGYAVKRKTMHKATDDESPIKR